MLTTAGGDFVYPPVLRLLSNGWDWRWRYSARYPAVTVSVTGHHAATNIADESHANAFRRRKAALYCLTFHWFVLVSEVAFSMNSAACCAATGLGDIAVDLRWPACWRRAAFLRIRLRAQRLAHLALLRATLVFYCAVLYGELGS